MFLTAALDNLDPATRDVFEESHSEDRVSSHHQLMTFVTRRLRALQLSEGPPIVELFHSPSRRDVPNHVVTQVRALRHLVGLHILP